jgi:intraflagellar transport protein 172
MAELKESYMKWLMETGQEEKVGQMYENAGDYREAINMYLKASLPAKAARYSLSITCLIHVPYYDTIQR